MANSGMNDFVPPLYVDRYERSKLDDLATFFSIIKATEHLERAFMNNAVKESEYTVECSKLIGQFKIMEKTLTEGNIISSAESFMDEYQMDCRKAKECLLTRGVPVTSLYRKPVADADAGAAIAETTSAIITCLDLLNLGNTAVDEVQPQLKEVLDSITKVPHLPDDFPGLLKIRDWLERLNAMRAVDSVDADAVRQLIFDLNSVYTAFVEFLKKGNK